MKTAKEILANRFNALPETLDEKAHCRISSALAAMEAYADQYRDKWVSVADRLPEKDGDSSIYCLVSTKHEGIVVRPYNEYHKCWDQEDGDDHFTESVGGNVTHWMPLPPSPTV